ncbi:HSP20-like chaperone [Mycena crocata]|nr:HSP20-like chaperone [Mycena crocata]
MSIARQLLHEFRPFFRMLDEPQALTRPSSIWRSRFDDPLFSPLNREMLRGPAVDVREAENAYVVEAELPGVKKENLEVRVGEGGRSLTIEGKLVAAPEENEQTLPASEETRGTISTERSLIGNFTRTIFLPRPVDGNSVAAKLNDGILQVTLNKAEDKASVVVKVE